MTSKKNSNAEKKTAEAAAPDKPALPRIHIPHMDLTALARKESGGLVLPDHENIYPKDTLVVNPLTDYVPKDQKVESYVTYQNPPIPTGYGLTICFYGAAVYTEDRDGCVMWQISALHRNPTRPDMWRVRLATPVEVVHTRDMAMILDAIRNFIQNDLVPQMVNVIHSDVMDYKASIAVNPATPHPWVLEPLQIVQSNLQTSSVFRGRGGKVKSYLKKKISDVLGSGGKQ